MCDTQGEVAGDVEESLCDGTLVLEKLVAPTCRVFD